MNEDYLFVNNIVTILLATLFIYAIIDSNLLLVSLLSVMLLLEILRKKDSNEIHNKIDFLAKKISNNYRRRR
jgi:hypothetical protein